MLKIDLRDIVLEGESVETTRASGPTSKATESLESSYRAALRLIGPGTPPRPEVLMVKARGAECSSRSTYESSPHVTIPDPAARAVPAVSNRARHKAYRQTSGGTLHTGAWELSGLSEASCTYSDTV